MMQPFHFLQRRKGAGVKAIREFGALAAAFAAALLALYPPAARAVDSAPFRLDTRSGTRVAGEVETIAYSTEWNDGGSVRVAADGTILVEAVAPASGDVVWNAAEAGAGLHTLTHVSGRETLTATFSVGRDVATVTLGDLERVYDGAPKPVAVETVPPGLPVSVTYDGGGEAPTGAGSYTVVAVVDDGVWVGGAAGVLEIAKRPQTIEFAEIGAQAVTNTVVLDATASSGLGVSYALEGPAVLDGNLLSFTGVGMVRIVASQAGDGNWEAAEPVEQVFGVGVAMVALGGLAQVYDGTEKSVCVETVPEGLAVAVTYDGSGEAPTGAGSYAVLAEVADADWVGAAEGVLVVAKGAQTIAFPEIGPQKTTDTVVLRATAGSGLAVDYAVEGPGILSGNVLTFTDAGTVRVVASQSGDVNWNAAADVAREFAVRMPPEPVHPGISGAFRLDTRSGARLAGEVESIAYSTEWNHGEGVRVEADGAVLGEAVAPASGDLAWNAVEAGPGLHTLGHISGGETLKAVFMVPEAWYQTVAFDANGGTCATAEKWAVIGKKYGALPTPKWSGHAFLGWFTEAAGGAVVAADDTVTDESARTLHAHWTDRQVTAFMGNGGKPLAQATTNAIYADYGAFPAAKWSGHALVGWFNAPEGGKRVYTNSTVTLAAARTLYAQWTTEQVTTFKANGGAPATQKTTNTIYADYGAFPAVKGSGDALVGWFNAPEGGKRVYTNSTVTLAAARTLYAQWTTNQVTTFKGNGGAPAIQKTTNAVYTHYGTLPKAVWENHAFLGWFNHPTKGKRVYTNSTVTLAATRSLYAHWTDRQVVTFKGNGGTPKTRVATNTMGGAYGTLPVPKRSGHAFLGWFTAADGGTEVTAEDLVAPEPARTLYAHWTDRQVTTFMGNGGEPLVQATTNTIYADYGAFPAVKWSGHVFLGWFNAPEGGRRVYTNSTVTLAATRTLYAQWAESKASPKGFLISGIAMDKPGADADWTSRDARAWALPGRLCTIRFEAAAGEAYEIQWAPSLLGEWQPMAAGTSSEGGGVEAEIELPADAPKGFFRVVPFPAE